MCINCAPLVKGEHELLTAYKNLNFEKYRLILFLNSPILCLSSSK